MKKLKSKKGESLIESLVAILIFTMSSILLYSMLSTASQLNLKAKEADEAHQEQMVHAEQAETPFAQRKTVTISLKTQTGTTTELFAFDRIINVYQLDEDSLYSFALDH